LAIKFEDNRKPPEGGTRNKRDSKQKDMKKCLQCEQVYGDDTNFCLSDGAALVSVSGSFTAHGETPTVYSGAPAPTVYNLGGNPPSYGGTPFMSPVSAASAPQPGKSNTLLIAAVVGFFALVVGGAVVGLVMYGLSKSDKKDTNVANVSNVDNKSNRNASDGQKSDNDNLAQNLKQQQDKLDKEKQRLEDERKALEAKKKQATPTPNSDGARTATIIDPPSNIRTAPNGTVLCIARTRGTVVNILGSTGVSDSNGVWYYTDYCGRQGVIHSTQIRF
jgi:hypothetical protein